jgi:hypothetical protein
MTRPSPKRSLEKLGLVSGPLRERIWSWLLAAAFLAALIYLFKASEDIMDAGKRLFAAERPKLGDLIQFWTGIGILIDALLILLLFLTRPLWLSETTPPPQQDRTRKSGWWAILLLIVLGALVLRLPRMNLGVYMDEAYSLRTYVHGKTKPTDSGLATLDPPSWAETLFLNRQGNNQVLYSATARVCNDLWKKLSGEPVRFSAPAVRLPSLVAGLLSIFLVAILLQNLGLSGTGLAAAAILAIHPWHIRYSTEARGYGMAMFAAVFLVWAAHHALGSQRWKWWALFGFAEFLCLATYQATLYHVTAVNLALLLYLGWPRTSESLRQFAQLTASNVLGAILTIPVVLPGVIQILEHLEVRKSHGALDTNWLVNWWAWMSTGVQWNSDDPGNPFIATVTGQSALPLLFPLVVGIIPLQLVLGIMLLLRQRTPATFLLLAGLAGAALAMGHAAWDGIYLFLWYLIFALPFLTAITCLPFDSLSRARPWLGTSAAVAFIALFAIATLPANQIIRHRSKEPLLDIVQAVYGSIDPFSPEAHNVNLIGFFTDAPIHAPQMRIAWTPADLIRELRRGIHLNKPTYVIYGHEHIGEERTPVHLAIVRNPALFEKIREEPGMEERQFTHHAAKFVGTEDLLLEAARELNIEIPTEESELRD